MSITLGAVITAIRDRHPLFHKTRVTDAVFARFLSDYQNELIGKALARDAGYLSQSVGIAIAFSTANAPGTVGAGTSGGLPGDVSGCQHRGFRRNCRRSALPAHRKRRWRGRRRRRARCHGRDGKHHQLDWRRPHDESGCRAAGAHYDWQRDRSDPRRRQQHRGAVDGQANWTTIPTRRASSRSSSANIGADETLGVVTQLPAVSTRSGYLVRINAQGVPYLDYTQPLVGHHRDAAFRCRRCSRRSAARCDTPMAMRKRSS
jgi:hypothetical protein